MKVQTLLQKTSDAKEAAEEKFSLLVDSVKDYGIFLMDSEGYILSWNSGAERIKGYTAADIIGKHFSIFYTESDLDRNHPLNELKLALENDRYEEEGWRIRKNGKKFWANVVITPLKDKSGKHVGFAKVTRDLTERKEAEESLRKSEERLRKMFEGIKDYALIMLDPEGHITSWNEGARRIKGWEANEIIGKSFKTFYPEQDVQMGKCEYELVEAGETGRFEDEGWRVRKDGTKFWASVLITAIRDEEGNLLGFSKVTRDITDKKRAEDLLKMAYANLEKRVRERTDELMKANQDLENAVQTRDEFLSIASHELRTPLTPLKLQIQSFAMNVKRKSIQNLSQERLEKMADTCERAISRMSGLIDNLLDVSRINTGKIMLTYERFDLRDMAQEILERFQPEASNNGSEITLDAPNPVTGFFDRIRAEQIFMNLLTNAIKYGNGKPITIRLTSDPHHVTMVFKDQGIGIHAKDLGRIFDRFERANSVTNIGGLGLGLYITKQIVEAHGGTIGVESKLSLGTTFKVQLPRDHEDS